MNIRKSQKRLYRMDSSCLSSCPFSMLPMAKIIVRARTKNPQKANKCRPKNQYVRDQLTKATESAITRMREKKMKKFTWQM